MRLRRLALGGAIAMITAAVIQCRHSSSSTPTAIGTPTAEGLPITFVSNLPAEMTAELYKNLPFIAAASNPAVGQRRDLPVRIQCEAFNRTENHCRMTYQGPEIRMQLAAFLFGTMSGNVTVSKGCQGTFCTSNPFSVWWRTKARQTNSGDRIYDFEVCDIRGLEASVDSITTDHTGPFDHLGQLLSSVAYVPTINGLRVSVAEHEESVPAFDERGLPKLDVNGKPETTLIRQYRPIAAFAGVGPIGAFPNSRCQLRGEGPDARFRDTTQMDRTATNINSLPKMAAEKIPVGYIRLSHDVVSELVKQSDGKRLQFNLTCLNQKPKSTCNITYRGPELTIPIPSYITGAVDAQVKILRECKNFGCKTRDEALIKLTAYPTGSNQALEVCSMTGVELAPDPKYFPGVSQHMGIPDIHGILMLINPDGRPLETGLPPKPLLTKAILGIGNIGIFPTNHCEI